MPESNNTESQSNNTESQSSSAAAESTAKKPRVFTDYSIKAILMRAELAVTGGAQS